MKKQNKAKGQSDRCHPVARIYMKWRIYNRSKNGIQTQASHKMVAWESPKILQGAK